MMLGMVLAALYASPTTVPIATPMMRVRRKPVPRDAIVPSAMLRLVRSAPAGVPDLPPMTEGYREGLPGPRITPGSRWGPSESALLNGGQVAQVDDAAVLQARVQQPPEVPRDAIRVGKLAGGLEVHEFLATREDLGRGCPELGLHVRVDGAGTDGEHLNAAADRLLGAHVSHPLVEGRLGGSVRGPARVHAPGGAGGEHDEVAGCPGHPGGAGGRGQEQVTQDLAGGAVEDHIRGVGARVHLAGEADGLERPGRMDEHRPLALEAGQLAGEGRAHNPPLRRRCEVGFEVLGPGRGAATDADDPGTGPRHRPDQRLPDTTRCP